jgi:hypothetical protein
MPPRGRLGHFLTVLGAPTIAKVRSRLVDLSGPLTPRAPLAIASDYACGSTTPLASPSVSEMAGLVDGRNVLKRCQIA